MRRVVLKTCVFFILGLFVFSLTQEAEAIPAFARKYRTSCMTCHAMTPRLNQFGEAVRLNGFRLPEEEIELRGETLMVKEEPVIMGAPAYRKVWPKAIWPSDIPQTVPLAIRWRPYWRAVLDKGDNLDKIRWELELFTAGTLGEDVHMFGHFNVEGGVDDSLKSDGTIDSNKEKEQVDIKIVGWLAQENLGDIVGLPEDLVNFMAGTVMMEEHDLPHYRSHSTYRLDATKPLYLNMIPYPSGFTEQNRFKIRRGPGIEMYGFTPRFHYATAFMVGNQQGGGTDLQTGALMMSYKIGGMDNYGSTKDEFQHGHQENSLGLGMIGWLGQSKVKYGDEARVMDNFRSLGFDARLRRKDFALHAGTVFASHNNPYGTLDTGKLDRKWWFVAPEYYFYPWFIVAVRYEEDVINVPAALGLADLKRARFHPYIGILIKANLRYVLTGTFWTDKRHDMAGNALDYNEITFLVDMTF